MSGQYSPRQSSGPAAVALALVALLLGGCSMMGDKPETAAPAAPASSSGGLLGSFFKPSTAAPTQEMVIVDDFQCPEIEMLDGAAAIRQMAGDTIRSQVSISKTARECTINGDNVTIKVGVEGRALLGSGGSPGTYSAPVRIVVKNGQTVVASRLQRQSVTIPSGDTQAPFVVVEDGIVVPKSDDLSILVGLDPNGRTDRAAKRRRKG